MSLLFFHSLSLFDHSVRHETQSCLIPCSLQDSHRMQLLGRKARLASSLSLFSLLLQAMLTCHTSTAAVFCLRRCCITKNHPRASVSFSNPFQNVFKTTTAVPDCC